MIHLTDNIIVVEESKGLQGKKLVIIKVENNETIRNRAYRAKQT